VSKKQPISLSETYDLQTLRQPDAELSADKLRNLNGKIENSNGAEAAPHSKTEIALNETRQIAGIVSPLDYNAKTPQVASISAACDSEAHTRAPTRNLKSMGRTISPSGSARHSVLSPREREVLALIVSGFSNRIGAFQLGISSRTFEFHRARIMEKIGAKNTADLVRLVLSEC
jgi:two-component system, LuxR family, response regulator FixJ